MLQKKRTNIYISKNQLMAGCTPIGYTIWYTIGYIYSISAAYIISYHIISSASLEGSVFIEVPQIPIELARGARQHEGDLSYFHKDIFLEVQDETHSFISCLLG